MDRRRLPQLSGLPHLPGVPPPPRKQDLSYTFFGGNVVRFLVHFFFTAAHFHLALVAASISHFVTAAAIFSCSSSNNKMSPLSFFFSRLCWPAAYSLFLLFLSLALYCKFLDMTINLSLIL